MEESFYITLEDICLIGGSIYTPKEIAGMELEILKTLKWRLTYPTPAEISGGLLAIFDLPSQIDSDALQKEIDNYVEFCLLGNLALPCSLR